MLKRLVEREEEEEEEEEESDGLNTFNELRPHKGKVREERIAESGQRFLLNERTSG